MKRFSIIVFSVQLLIGMAHAEQRFVLNGVFCNTEKQIEDTIVAVGDNVSLEMAIEQQNRDAVNCVYADKIKYVVIDPAALGKLAHNGTIFMKYEATLVGALVGGKPRPIAPPVRTFFFWMGVLTGSAK